MKKIFALMLLFPVSVYSQSWLGPEEMAFVDDTTLAILEKDAKKVDFFSLEQKKRVGEVRLDQTPSRMIRVGDDLFVSCGELNGEVVKIAIPERKIVRRWTGIHTPSGLAYSGKWNRLFVGRRFHNDILVLDGNREGAWEDARIQIVPAVREPTAMVLLPDETKLYVANLLPMVASDDSTISGCVTIVDVETLKASHQQLPDGVNNLRDITCSPDGRYVFVVHTHGNHRTITSQLFGGWTNRNGMTILDREAPDSACVYLVDDFQNGLPNPWEVRISPDGKLLALTIGGSRETVFLAMDELIAKMHRDMNGVSRNYSFFFGVGSLSQTMTRVRMEAIQGVHALAMNDRYTVSAGYFTDNLAVFRRHYEPKNECYSEYSKRSYQRAGVFTETTPEILPLGPAPQWTAERRGEVYFHDGDLSVESWHSCVTCHPDARVDGMNWDLLNDGVQNHKNTKSMLYCYETPPCMITGVRENAEVATRAGFIHIHFLPMDEARYQDVDAYLKSLRPVPGIRRRADGSLTESARRGKRLFYGNRTGCSSCHSGEYFTDLKLHDVGYHNESDIHDAFDTPTLIELFRTMPYMHDGHYLTLEDLLFTGRHGDVSGRLDKLSPQEKEDLVEYLLSL
ncbi:MAG: hypothetical protein Q4D98_12585 [Planctomycetia bacterium]|nr:hypothetical protein [Planctomycetia bacterium]